MADWWEDGRSAVELAEEWSVIVEAFGGRLRSGWQRAACPRCRELEGRDDYKASLSLNRATWGYNCFKCGMHGRLPLEWQEKLLEASEDEWAPAQAAAPTELPELEQAEGYIPLFEPPGEGAMVLDWARHYVLAPKTELVGAGRPCRGLSIETARSMQVGAALEGKLRGRVIFPIPNYADQTKPWRGWVARDATGMSTLPYRYPKGMQRIGLVYNEPALYRMTDFPCFIGEGVLDAAPLWPDAVACLGKPLESQLERFLGARRPLVVMLDGDAHLESAGLAFKLRTFGKRAVALRFPPRTDPDDVDRDWLLTEAFRLLELGSEGWAVQ